jgi:precorrin-8X/cobalt-precorrin-8 methylmutase
MSASTAVLLAAHGSKRPEANAGVHQLAERLSARLGGVPVRAGFLEFAAPDIPETATALVGEGVSSILLQPYFLHRGAHVDRDLPRIVEELCDAHPTCSFTILDALGGDPLVEDALVDRLAIETVEIQSLPATGPAIEARSHAIIDRRLALDGLDPASHAIVRRVVHATADFSFAHSMRIHPEAVERGREALRAGRPVICDSTILQAGITRTASDVRCAIRDPAVARRATAEKITRATAAMELLAEEMDDAIVAIGNAPTALWTVMRLAEEGKASPALVVGMPVGFVGAHESKRALAASERLAYVTNLSPRGGSPAAAAAVNALALLESP